MQAPQSFNPLQVDMHAHWLPGIDDGAATIEDSLHLMRSLRDMGYKKLIATPHVYIDHYPNTPESILNAFESAKKAAAEDGLELQLEAAAEYYLDEHFESLLETDNILTFNNKRVLVEMSFIAPYPNLHQIIYALRRKGYKPVLAHPERYLYYAKDLETLEKIQSYGCELQVNLLSLVGYYGKAEKRLAQKMLEAELVDYLGTDLHHQKHLDALHTLSADRSFRQILEQYPFKNRLL